ncbi:hypothetical protein LX32DRAFT_21704 [Colletotrichum zoysiae]|uniref:Secreted protein n=1 Tax=Colletotrichum zoysiae TaxID=1216348 RepID=A0AAD9LXV7_9PEZI|nr:hypothetical protein LX32DRAFT_21704 [Colletotrichum zoysiae]
MKLSLLSVLAIALIGANAAPPPEDTPGESSTPEDSPGESSTPTPDIEIHKPKSGCWCVDRENVVMTQITRGACGLGNAQTVWRVVDPSTYVTVGPSCYVKRNRLGALCRQYGAAGAQCYEDGKDPLQKPGFWDYLDNWSESQLAMKAWKIIEKQEKEASSN